MPNIEIPDVIKSASDAAQDNLPATMEQTDGVLSTVVGFFNNVVLYPVKKANLTFRYKLEAFEDDLKDKTKHIPPENLQEPPVMIAGPTLEALRYTYDEKELREMYENLLASAMDNRIASQVHPSYVDAIRQMSPLDARVLNEIFIQNSVYSFHVEFHIKQEKKWFPDAMPYHFCDKLCHVGDPFEISVSLSNLIRLGLLHTQEVIFKEDVSDRVKNHPYVQSMYNNYPPEWVELKVNPGGSLITLDNYGKGFAQVCLPKEK